MDLAWTTVAGTQQAGSIPTPISTETPAVAETPLGFVSAEMYDRIVSSRFVTFQEAWNEFIPLHQQFSQDITLAANNDFYFKIYTLVFRIEAGAQELASMNSFPPEFMLINQALIALNNEVAPMSIDYYLALDNQDIDAFKRAAARIVNIPDLINRTSDEFHKISDFYE